MHACYESQIKITIDCKYSNENLLPTNTKFPNFPNIYIYNPALTGKKGEYQNEGKKLLIIAKHKEESREHF